LPHSAPIAASHRRCCRAERAPRSHGESTCTIISRRPLQLVKPSQIVFGTDFPPGGSAASAAAAIAATGMFSDADLRAVDRDNAVRLLPRFA
jgi:predicted TIM-barrel fold metal-dependent hydrolase